MISSPSLRGNVILATTHGEIELELFWDHAPKTCRNFFELTRQKYYDNCIFHRVSKNFVIQSGDPTGTGAGGESIYGKFMDDEIHPALKHEKGTLSMANIGKPNTNGSQFFICLDACPYLDSENTIFGKVVRGINVAEKISMAPTQGMTERPKDEMKIIKTYISIL